MEATAIARFARIAPRKARTIVNLVRGRKVAEAIDTLMFTRRSAAPIVRKVIESALANAKHKDPSVDIDGLYVSIASVDKGPTGNMRRWRPRAMGRATRVEKGVSHIAVTLSDTEPQRAALYPEMGVVEYLQFAADLRAIPKSEQRERIKKVVGICGLEEALRKEIGQLSFGYRQRVGLAQALIHDPPILILDEPTADLDPNESAEVIKYIKEIGKTRTVMLSTHDLAEVEAACARVLIVSRGKIVADGAPDDLRAGSGSVRYRLAFDEKEGLGASDKAPRSHEEIAEAIKSVIAGATVKDLPGDGKSFTVEATVKGSGDSRRELFQMAVQKGWALLELRRETLQLEEVFRQLTTDGDKGGKAAKAEKPVKLDKTAEKE